jgi:hypothetical protein
VSGNSGARESGFAIVERRKSVRESEIGSAVAIGCWSGTDH